MPGRQEDHAALMRAHGLRPSDPLMLLNARLAARGGPAPAARPQDAAAALLDDAEAMRRGSPLRIALNLPTGEPLPTAFAVPDARSAGAAWHAGTPPGIPVPDGHRRVLLASLASPLRIDWALSLSDRVRGVAGAVRLAAGTPVAAVRAHDPDLPAALGTAGLGALAAACPAIEPTWLLWSAADLPSHAIGGLARRAGLRVSPLPLPDGFALLLAAGDPSGLALLGDREALAAAYRAGAPARTLLALPRALDLRLLGAPGGVEALAALAEDPVAEPVATGFPQPRPRLGA